MKQQLANLAQYKHYLILLSALLVANYILVPLIEWQEQKHQSFKLIEKRRLKVANLIENEVSFDEQLTLSAASIKQAATYVFADKSESAFKLTSQSIVEKILTDAGCNVERIGFKGNTILNENLKRWMIEIRYKGDSECMVKVTRGLESHMPVIHISDLNYSHRSLTEEGAGSFNAQMTVNVWHAQGLDVGRVKGLLQVSEETNRVEEQG